jgi:hypothetical protein
VNVNPFMYGPIEDEEAFREWQERQEQERFAAEQARLDEWLRLSDKEREARIKWELR